MTTESQKPKVKAKEGEVVIEFTRDTLPHEDSTQHKAGEQIACSPESAQRWIRRQAANAL